MPIQAKAAAALHLWADLVGCTNVAAHGLQQFYEALLKLPAELSLQMA